MHFGSRVQLGVLVPRHIDIHTQARVEVVERLRSFIQLQIVLKVMKCTVELTVVQHSELFESQRLGPVPGRL